MMQHDCESCEHTRPTVSGERVGLWASLLPAIACAFCPACLTVWSGLFSAFGAGTGHALSEEAHDALLAASLATALGTSLWRAWRTRRWSELVLPVLGSGLVTAGHLADAGWLEWTGTGCLVASAAWSWLAHRLAHARGDHHHDHQHDHAHEHGHGRPSPGHVRDTGRTCDAPRLHPNRG
jgi:hypothetical protein